MYLSFAYTYCIVLCVFITLYGIGVFITQTLFNLFSGAQQFMAGEGRHGGNTSKQRRKKGFKESKL